MQSVQYNPIGIINSPFRDFHGMPIQLIGTRGIKGQIELNEEYELGLKD